MATKNDRVILNLQKEIAEKEKQLERGEKFVPITNCSLELNGSRLNLHAASKEQLKLAIATVSTLKNALASELPGENLVIGGFDADDWLSDLKTKFANLNQAIERERLKGLKTKLHNLLSVDTKVELEIEELKKSI